ncbi:relaxase/mobilization nuclease domain-containing protein [Chryseolinea lacunae]|uniref:Relaxase/mobilization nuclease domain-containing protein n=1 Tax=Chryseolinea lacunae TaxID=2801331 RepID=A0ABS1KNR1_9BACT|nr:relaxase/mobilization nuclease domain-containing protein [Chryseolinea lacunae]MBL0741071.1 relaxase/mobilization nuclease domain-containing protein [Chryseolinea lacunae]
MRYNLEKLEKNLAEVLDHSFSRVTEKSIMKEIQMVKVLRPNLQKFFYHTSLNFPPHENLSNDTMRQIANDYLKANGFSQHQFIIFRHYDADHPHLHILVNRIGYDGKVLSDSNDFARSEKILRGLEIKYNLTNVAPSKQATKRAVTKDELEMMKRTGGPSLKIQLQAMVKGVLDADSNMTVSEFIQALEKKGIAPQFNIASTGYVSGVSYSYQGMVMTGSKLGNEFKWTTLKDKIDYEKERDSQIILNANSRSKTVATKRGHMDGLKKSPISSENSTKPPFRTNRNLDASPKPKDLPNATNPSVADSLAGIIGGLISPHLEHDQAPEASLRLTRKRKRRKGFGR